MKKVTKQLESMITKRGLVEIRNNKFAKSMDDLLEALKRDSVDKKKKFMAKFRKEFKVVEYKIKNRTLKYLVASPNFTDGVVSDIQAKAFIDEDITIKSKREREKEQKLNRKWEKITKGLEESINYHFEGKLSLINDELVSLETGEIVMNKESLKREFASMSKNNFKFNVEESLFNFIIKLIEKLERKVLVNKLDRDDFGTIRFFKSFYKKDVEYYKNADRIRRIGIKETKFNAI